MHLPIDRRHLWPVMARASVYPYTRFNDVLDPNPYYHG